MEIDLVRVRGPEPCVPRANIAEASHLISVAQQSESCRARSDGPELVDVLEVVAVQLLELIDEWEPYCVTVAFPCTPWTQLQSINMARDWQS